MDKAFWHRKWERNEIGFHEDAANPLLVRHIGALGLTRGQRIFLPLCGKTGDIGWLLASGLRVAGIELSQIAVDALFGSLQCEPVITAEEGLLRYQAANIDIFVGDVFALTPAALGAVDAVYDRAALVALDAAVRPVYAAHVASLTRCAPQLLVTYAYDQALMAGPPFALGDEEVTRLYGARHALRMLERARVEGGFKGRFPAQETVWLLT